MSSVSSIKVDRFGGSVTVARDDLYRMPKAGLLDLGTMKVGASEDEADAATQPRLPPFMRTLAVAGDALPLRVQLESMADVQQVGAAVPLAAGDRVCQLIVTTQLERKEGHGAQRVIVHFANPVGMFPAARVVISPIRLESETSTLASTVAQNVRAKLAGLDVATATTISQVVTQVTDAGAGHVGLFARMAALGEAIAYGRPFAAAAPGAADLQHMWPVAVPGAAPAAAAAQYVGAGSITEAINSLSERVVVMIDASAAVSRILGGRAIEVLWYMCQPNCGIAAGPLLGTVSGPCGAFPNPMQLFIYGSGHNRPARIPAQGAALAAGAPAVGWADWLSAYNWLIEALRASDDADAGVLHAASVLRVLGPEVTHLCTGLDERFHNLSGVQTWNLETMLVAADNYVAGLGAPPAPWPAAVLAGRYGAAGQPAAAAAAVGVVDRPAGPAAGQTPAAAFAAVVGGLAGAGGNVAAAVTPLLQTYLARPAGTTWGALITRLSTSELSALFNAMNGMNMGQLFYGAANAPPVAALPHAANADAFLRWGVESSLPVYGVELTCTLQDEMGLGRLRSVVARASGAVASTSAPSGLTFSVATAANYLRLMYL